jgi:hypothetical protein
LPELPLSSNAGGLERLKRLAAIYSRDHSGDGWMAKEELGAFYDYFPETRHALLRPLYDTDWTELTAGIEKAIRSGSTLILTGEDVNLDPASGLAVWPHFDGKQLPALAAAMKGARWSLATADGDTIAASLGQGRLILSRESVDAAGHTNADAARWQQRWWAEIKAMEKRPPIPIPTPDAAALAAWWSGQRALTDSPRTVRWFEANQREARVALRPKQPSSETVVVAIPPTGAVHKAALSGSATGRARLDVGCAGGDPIWLEGAWKFDLAQAINRYLAWRPPGHPGPDRDGNGWRRIPLCLTAPETAAVTLGSPEVVVQSP